MFTSVVTANLLPLAQSSGAESGGISGVTIWVGLIVLLVILLAIIIRDFGRRRRVDRDLPTALPGRAEPDAPADKAPSLKEIKAARAARLPSELTDRDALVKARQARKGASRATIDDAEPRVPGSDEKASHPRSPDDRTSLPAAPEGPTPPDSTDARDSTDAGDSSLAATTPDAGTESLDSTEAPEVVPQKTLKEGLERTRSGFVSRLRGLFAKKKTLDSELMGELEEVLLTADIGVKTSMKLLRAVEAKLAGNGEVDSAEVYEYLREQTSTILADSQRPLTIGEARPFVILVIGVNGVGKTTTIGKLASRYLADGHSVLLIAADTFRAAAIDQLKVWGARAKCEVFAGPEGGDPSSVVFDGLKRAGEMKADIVLVDTAGRLHTKVNLVGELKKVRRVCDKSLPGAPHEILLVLDANTGQNAINQAEMFGKEVGVTGIALTKLDGTAKGGVVIGISDELGVPVQFIGIGEQVEDLREFDADEFVEAIF